MEPQDQTIDHEYERQCELDSDYAEHLENTRETAFDILKEKIQELEDECFKLSAYHCEAPYMGEGGSMGCKVVDYWRQRCELAEKILSFTLKSKPNNVDLSCKRTAIEAYNKFIKENKQP